MKKLIIQAAIILLTATSTLAQEIPISERQARTTTDDVTQGVIYQINARAFTEEGTLTAAAQRLPKIAELGVTIVYLCPIFVADDDMRQEFWSPRQKASGMNNPRNPYRMKDFYHVDPEYGTDDDLKAFVADAHALGLKVMLDMVYLHCGPTAVFIESHPDFVKRNAQGVIENAGWSFPGLNFDSLELREYLWKNMEYWVVDFDVDGFRLDVADGIPLDFWKEARRRLDAIRPGLILLAEGTRNLDQLETMDLNYGFAFFGALDSVLTKNAPASELRKNWENVVANNPKGARFTRYTDNHDIANDDYLNRRETRWGYDCAQTALALCFMMDGTPMLYNGQELADNARHSIFGRAPIKRDKENDADGKARFQFVRELIRLRREHNAVTDGSLKWLDVEPEKNVVAFLRDSGDERIVCVFNLKNETVEGSVDLSNERLGVLSVESLVEIAPICSKGACAIENSRLDFVLPPFAFDVCILK